MAKRRGLRSSNDAKPWKCRCGKVNQPTKHRFFDLPAFQCHSCKSKFNGNFKFCLGEIEADGGSLIGEVEDQKKKPHCVAYAYCKAVEISERIFNVNNQKDPNDVECINPDELQQRFHEKFPEFPSADFLGRDFGIHKVLHMGLILQEEGIQKDQSRDTYKAEDLSTIARDDFEEIARCLAEGIPLVATYHAGKRRGHLRYCQIYKSPPRDKGEKYSGHAVVLVGAGMKNGRRFFYFLNSWGERFCPRKNTRGETKMSGIGKIRASDLTKNVIKLSHPHKTDVCRRLEAQNESDISKDNYFLMMATKKQYASIMLRKAKLGKLQGDDKKAKSGKPQCDYNDFEKIREDHLIHGAFCDDEAEYPQAAVYRYNELAASFTEMEWCLVEEDLRDKLHHDQSASAETDHTIHLVRGVAQPATSGAPAATSHRASMTPSSGPAGGLGDLHPGFGATGTASGRSLGLFGTGCPELDQMQQQLTQNPHLLREMMNMPMVKSLMNNPDLIHNVNVSTPGMREIIYRNPDIAHVLNDPIVVCQTLEAARNPEILTKMMRNTDRAMSKIESCPEGFNMLWHMYETVQEPFLSITTMGGEGNTASNLAAALLGNQGSNQPSNPATIVPTPGSESTTGTPAPNSNPLPNPWSTKAGGAQGATWSGPAGNIRNGSNGGLGGVGSADSSNMFCGLAGNVRTGTAGGLGGLGSADTGSTFGGLPDASLLSQIVQNPAMMQNNMSDPQLMNQLLSINPNARNLVESNIQSREMFQNPELLRQLTSPETLQHLLSFQQTSLQLGQHQPSQDGNKGGNVRVPPEEICATQLTRLQEMGFIDTAENIRALIFAGS